MRARTHTCDPQHGDKDQHGEAALRALVLGVEDGHDEQHYEARQRQEHKLPLHRPRHIQQPAPSLPLC